MILMLKQWANVIFFQTKNIKYLFYRFNNYLLFRGLPSVPVRHSKIVENDLIMREVQNRDQNTYFNLK